MSAVPRRPLVAIAVLLAALTSIAVPVSADAATSSALTRYPYLTDSIQTSITVNWATDRSAGTGSATYGPPGNCDAHQVTGTRSNLSIPASPAFSTSAAEYQWKAVIPVTPDTTYCYRVQLGGTDLLGSDPSPQFVSQAAAGSSTPFSFAVFGDWGQSYDGGANPDQANVLQQIASSGARFAVMTGDTAYPGGGQKEYGDRQRPDLDTSTVFGPGFWEVPGRSVPVFNVTGNHGFSNGDVQVLNWPEENAAAPSGGRYVYEPYGSVNGSSPHSYPSMWYAVDAGPIRIYALTAAWADGNIGTGSVYRNDRDAHWTPSSAEYQWLAADLAAHPNAVKIAFWHYPLYADSSSQPSDTELQGAPGSSTLQGLLDQHHVRLVFNGHAHGYQRNAADPAGLVSYVVGNGGAALGSVSGCTARDLYAIGKNGSHCGAAPAGLSNDHVYGFIKVSVGNNTLTVTPTDELGRTYDVQTYPFTASDGGGGGGGGGSVSSFNATEDATVDSSRPTTALGTGSRLTADNSPVSNSLIKFSVTGLTCTPTSAQLRLTVGSSTDDKSVYGGDVYDTTSGWSQSAVTWNTAPAAGTRRGSITGAVALDTSYLADVTGAVTGNGTVSFMVKSTSSDGVRYYSSEAGSSAQTPQLQVTC